jgi:hypothetical protein
MVRSSDPYAHLPPIRLHRRVPSHPYDEQAVFSGRGDLPPTLRLPHAHPALNLRAYPRMLQSGA